MDPPTFTIEDDPRPEDVALINDGLTRFNFAATGVDNGRWLAIFVRDASGQIEAGLHGWTWGHTGFVQTLWVRDDLHGRGLGSRLLDAAEREAEHRGCIEMQLDTHDYQAPTSIGGTATNRLASFQAGLETANASSFARHSDGAGERR
jgi:GNAT superfamily N-acetyltransferase